MAGLLLDPNSESMLFNLLRMKQEDNQNKYNRGMDAYRVNYQMNQDAIEAQNRKRQQEIEDYKLGLLKQQNEAANRFQGGLLSINAPVDPTTGRYNQSPLQNYRQTPEEYQRSLAVDAIRAGNNELGMNMLGMGQPYTLSPGQVRYNSFGQPVARGGVDPALQSKMFEQENKLRDEYITGVKPFIESRNNFQKVQESASARTPAGDMSLVFAYMKTLDPASTVREGEQADASQTTNVPGWILNLYNKAVSGERLSDTQRKDFVSMAHSLYTVQENSFDTLTKEYTRLAKSNNLNPGNVIVQYDKGKMTFKPMDEKTGKAAKPTQASPPPGFTTQRNAYTGRW